MTNEDLINFDNCVYTKGEYQYIYKNKYFSMKIKITRKMILH